MDIKAYVEGSGAYKAGWVLVEDVPFDPVLREACAANYCGSYGKNHTCPPNVGEINALIAQAQQYKYLLLYQTVGQLEDSFDFEGMQDAGLVHKQLTLEIRDGIDLPDALTLGAGGCRICETCAAKTDEPCRFPARALASLEAYGINVSKTAALAGMNYINGENTVTYFSGIFLPAHYQIQM